MTHALEPAVAPVTVGQWRSISEQATNPGEVIEMPRIFWKRSAVWGPIIRHVDTNTSHPHLFDFLATLIVATNATTVVEAGTYRGHATFAMAEAFHLAGKAHGHIYTADVVDHHVEDVLQQTGLRDYVTFHHGRFEHMLELIAVPIDLAFIDASERERPALRIEYVNRVAEQMAVGGVIVVDDCASDEWPGARVLRDACPVYLPLGRGTALFQRR